MIRIFIPTPLRKFTAEKSLVEVEASTVSEAIQNLALKHPELDQHLFDADRSIRKFVRIFLGDQDIYQIKGPDTPLKTGDEISIIPAIAGGRTNSNSSANSRSSASTIHFVQARSNLEAT